MKLNQDCIRDLLLYLEEHLDCDNELRVNDISLKDYSTNELISTAQRLSEVGYLNCNLSNQIDLDVPVVEVSSISYNGHQFLDTIKDNHVWTNTKKVLSSLKSISIDVISETASKVITSMIDKNLNF
ncbi:MAG: DUF2513 domain-containing protein [Clostridia bacterium]|nr:DUF2513 domain-containing protein [Clostridia bacterium]